MSAWLAPEWRTHVSGHRRPGRLLGVVRRVLGEVLREAEQFVELLEVERDFREVDRHVPSGADALVEVVGDEIERPSYNTFLDYFKNAAGRADVAKEVTPTNFRKSNTRWLVLLGMSQARIEDRQGRKRGSEHTRRYLARFGEESNERTYARLHGKDVEVEEPEELDPIDCPRCSRETPRNRDRCMWCHFALSHEAAKDAETKREAALRAVTELTDEEDIGDAEAAIALNGLIDERVQSALDEQRHS